jgi:hypothetical protein
VLSGKPRPENAGGYGVSSHNGPFGREHYHAFFQHVDDLDEIGLVTVGSRKNETMHVPTETMAHNRTVTFIEILSVSLVGYNTDSP